MADNSKRTPEELLLPEYNYYLFFRISPKETDAAKIEKAILQERNKWTSDSTPVQLQYRDRFFPDVIAVMVKDPAARAQELDAAKRLKLKSAIDLIAAICRNKGMIYKSEVLNIAKSDSDWITVADLESKVANLKKQGIKYIDDTQSIIDFTRYIDVEKWLVTVKKATIYDLLGCDSNSSVKEIASAISSVYSSPRKKTSGEGTATDMLIGAARVIFKTEQSKTEYDNYLALKDNVWRELELRRSYGVKEISLEEYLAYAKIIQTTLKMDIDKVETYLSAGLKFFKIIVVGEAGTEIKGSKGATISLENCPYPECGLPYLVYPGAALKSCPHCYKPLEIICWNCGGKMPYTAKNKVCPTCKCTYQSKALFGSRISDVEKALNSPNASVADLRSVLANLKNAVPTSTYASNTNVYAAKKITEYEKLIMIKIKKEEADGERYRAEASRIRDLMNRKCYLQARSSAVKLQSAFTNYNSSGTKELISDIDKVLTQARAHLNSAKACATQNNETMAVLYAAKVLEICADHSEALQLIRKYPPKAPTTVRHTVSIGNVIRIEWDNSNDQSTTYTVIKKIGSKPVSPDDGTPLDKNLTINFYEDRNVASATPYYYGVFAERCGVCSAVTSTVAPAVVFLDVSGVRQDIVEGRISVKWDCPHNVKTVEVWKKPGPVAPVGVEDGVQIKTADRDGFTDDKCDYENSYLIVCAYEMNGRKKYSRGVKRTLKEYESLHKIENIKVNQVHSGEFIFKCTGLSDQKLKFICSKDRLTCRLDTALQMLDYNSVCKNCIVVDPVFNADHDAEFSLPAGQICWVYPMIYNDQLFMLSEPLLLNNVIGIRNVTCAEERGTVQINGTLCKDAKRITAVISNTEFPTDVNTKGDKVVVTKEQFDANGGLTYKLRTNTVSYISLFVEIEKDGAKTLTRACLVGDKPIDYREKAVVYYTVDFKISPTRKFTISISFSSNVAVTLPSLCLVKGSPRPSSKNTGELVTVIEPGKLAKPLLSKKYRGKAQVECGPCPPNTKFALYLNDASIKYIQLKEVKTKTL
ncbi:MAG: hypothetical protein J5585_02750 [Clostridia bacterium]|nr:hypothetical protein [Clostridia bacterium]